MANRLTQIATRTGDDGTTGLGTGQRVPKDHLRVQALGARPLFDPALEYLVLIGLTLVSYPLGRWVFARAEQAMRRRGMLAQY